MTELNWRKAAGSDAHGQCVEVAAASRSVAVRDSKDPAGPTLVMAAAAFGRLLTDLKRR